MALTDPVLTGRRIGRTITHGDGSSAELKVQGEPTGGKWAVVEWRVRRRRGPIHTHTREDETVYVLEGAITALVGDQRFAVEAVSYGALPKGLPHGSRCAATRPGSWSLWSRPERSTSSFRGMRAIAIPRSSGSRSRAQLPEVSPDAPNRGR